AIPAGNRSLLKLIDTLTYDFVNSYPESGATGVARDAVLKLNFTHPVRVPDLQSENQYLSRYLSLIRDNGTTEGVATEFEAALSAADNRIIEITPADILLPNSRYRIELKPELGSRRSEGLMAHKIYFTTAQGS